MRRALLARVPERVGEHEAPLGVGVRDLDRLAVRGREDVARAGTRRRSACSRRRRRPRARAPAARARRSRRCRRARPRRRPCRPSCPPCAAAGLSEMPPVSNVIALPTSPSTMSPRAAAAARSAGRSGAARCALPCADGERTRPCRARAISSGPSASAVRCSSSAAISAARSASALGRELVRRAVRRGRGRGSSTPATRAARSAACGERRRRRRAEDERRSSFALAARRLPARRGRRRRGRARRRPRAPARRRRAAASSSSSHATRAADAAERACDAPRRPCAARRRRRVRWPTPGDADARASELAVGVEERGPAELALAARRRRRGVRAARRARVERCRGAGRLVVAGQRNREDVGLDLLRRDRLDLDSHGRAMLADRLRSLPPHEGDLPPCAVVPIDGSWHAACHCGTCGRPVFGGAGLPRAWRL